MAKKAVSRKSKRRLMTLGVISVFCIGYFLITFVGYIYNFVSLKQEEKNLKAELVSLQEEKANLKIEIQKLNNPEYVARYAKEKYLYSSNGEYVLKIDTKEEKQVDKKTNNQTIIYVIGGSVVLFIGICLLARKKKKIIKKNPKINS